MVEKEDARANQLAKDIFTKFLKPKVGLCAFIDQSTREVIGRRVKQLSAGVLDSSLFDQCAPQLETFLRRQHALFVESKEFLDLLNAHSVASCSGGGQAEEQHIRPPRRSRRANSTNKRTTTATVASEDGQIHLPPTTPRLTASTLLRTQKDREATLGQSSVEKMFKPVSRYPYVGNATTSKKDSAVSSSFSSEANASRRGGQRQQRGFTLGGFDTLPSRFMREEQRRANPVLASIPVCSIVNSNADSNGVIFSVPSYSPTQPSTQHCPPSISSSITTRQKGGGSSQTSSPKSSTLLS